MPKPHISKAPLSRPLNLMQQRFVHEYLADEVATAAARRAGYSGKRARWQACDLMKNPRVLAAIAAERRRRAGPMTRDEAVEALRRIAQANVLDYARPGPDGALELDLWRLERDRAGAVRELTVVERTDPKSGAVTRTVGFKLADRSAALMKLLPMLEADGATLGMARGRRIGVETVAELSVEAFGRFKAVLDEAGRGRKARPAADEVLEAFMDQEAAARPGLDEARVEQALAARMAELDDLAAQLDSEWEQITDERRALTQREHGLVRREAEMAGRG